MGIFMNLLGFSRDSEGNIQFGLGTMLGTIVTLGLAWELWSLTADKWGGALVLGVWFGIILFFVIPLQLLFKSVR